jgi:membrane associated rhomboid family serine protease
MSFAIGIIGVLVAIGALVFLPDPASLGVGAAGVLFALMGFFLRRVSAEPAVGTNDAPEVSPTKDYDGSSV